MNKKALSLVFGLMSAVLFVIAGVTVLVLCLVHQFQFTGLVLGIILLVVSVIRIIDFMISEKHKDRHNVALLFAIALIVMGILFIAEVRELSMLCFGWGVIDIVLSAIEIQFAVPEIKHNKLCILEVAISCGELLFGILLCIKLESGLTGHLIYLSISLFLLAVLALLEALIHKHE